MLWYSPLFLFYERAKPLPRKLEEMHCCWSDGKSILTVVYHKPSLSLSHVRLFATPWTAARQASLSFSISRSLLKLMSIELVTEHFM